MSFNDSKTTNKLVSERKSVKNDHEKLFDCFGCKKPWLKPVHTKDNKYNNK